MRYSLRKLVLAGTLIVETLLVGLMVQIKIGKWKKRKKKSSDKIEGKKIQEDKRGIHCGKLDR